VNSAKVYFRVHLNFSNAKKRQGEVTGSSLNARIAYCDLLSASPMRNTLQNDINIVTISFPAHGSTVDPTRFAPPLGRAGPHRLTKSGRSFKEAQQGIACQRCNNVAGSVPQYEGLRSAAPEMISKHQRCMFRLNSEICETRVEYQERNLKTRETMLTRFHDSATAP